MFTFDAFILQASTVSWNESVYTMFALWCQVLSLNFFVSLPSRFVFQKKVIMDFVHISLQTHASSFFIEITQNLRIFFYLAANSDS
jgi:uncharacterized membrane protein YwzB